MQGSRTPAPRRFQGRTRSDSGANAGSVAAPDRAGQGAGSTGQPEQENSNTREKNKRRENRRGKNTRREIAGRVGRRASHPPAIGTQYPRSIRSVDTFRDRCALRSMCPVIDASRNHAPDSRGVAGLSTGASGRRACPGCGHAWGRTPASCRRRWPVQAAPCPPCGAGASAWPRHRPPARR